MSLSFPLSCCAIKSQHPASVFPSLCCSCCLVAEVSSTLCDPMDYNLPGFSVHGILQARILEWVAISLGDLPDTGIKPGPATLAGRFSITELPRKPCVRVYILVSGTGLTSKQQISSFIFLFNILTHLIKKENSCIC